jgi:hypothetical protein
MKSMWIGLLLLLPAMERRAATSAMATDHAVASGTTAALSSLPPLISENDLDALGMGRGEFQAAFANFRALTVVAAPLFYGQLYARLGDRYAYLGGAAVVAIAELCHRSLSAKDLALGAKEGNDSKAAKALDWQPCKGLRGVLVGSGSDGMNEAEVAAEILRLTGKEQPRVLYLGAATYDLPGPRARQTVRFEEAGCMVMSLDLATPKANETDPAYQAKLAAAVQAADAIVVSGGNTLYAADRFKSVRECLRALLVAFSTADVVPLVVRAARWDWCHCYSRPWNEGASSLAVVLVPYVGSTLGIPTRWIQTRTEAKWSAPPTVVATSPAHWLRAKTQKTGLTSKFPVLDCFRACVVLIMTRYA